MYFMAVKKSRKQVLVSDLFIFKRRCIYRDTETTVILSEFTCKIVFTKKKTVAQGNLLMSQPAQQALGSSGHKKKTVFTPRVSPSRAPVISFAHYFQASATQATNVFDKLDTLGLPIRKGKAFQHTERKKQANKQTILQEFCNVTGDTQITSDLGIARMDTFTRGYPKH